MSHTKVTSGKFTWKLHSFLKDNLDHLIKANKNDWDFKLLVSGDGMTRTGKTTIAVQCAAYLDDTFIENWKERMIFDGQGLIKVSQTLKKGSAIVYDEAREGLDSKKQMERYTKNLLDFFSQCGNLNLYIFIVLPDFFELPKSIAVVQTMFLINCHTKDGFERGYFEFYNRRSKKGLYIKGSRYLDYKSWKPSFKGTFTKFFPIPRKEYEERKTTKLAQLRKRESASQSRKQAETHRNRCSILIDKFREGGWKVKEIAQLLGVDTGTIHHTYKSLKMKNE